jgi:hypothetical protein
MDGRHGTAIHVQLLRAGGSESREDHRMSNQGDVCLPQIEMADLGYGFDLSATREDLQRLAAALRVATRIRVAHQSGEEASLVVSRTTGPLIISHDGPDAVLRGDPFGIEKFALTVEAVAAEPEGPRSVGAHAHIEFYPGHPWLAKASEAVVLSVKN